MPENFSIPWRLILQFELLLAVCALLPLLRPRKGVVERLADPGVEILRWLGLGPAAGVLGVEGFRPEWNDWARWEMPGALRGAGALLALAAIGLIAWAILSLGREFSGTLALRQEHRLIQRGPYRYVRHPMYVLGLLLMTGLCLLSGLWPVGLGGLLAMGSLMIGRVPKEEKMLREQFGAEWDEYVGRTGKFWPK